MATDLNCWAKTRLSNNILYLLKTHQNKEMLWNSMLGGAYIISPFYSKFSGRMLSIQFYNMCVHSHLKLLSHLCVSIIISFWYWNIVIFTFFLVKQLVPVELGNSFTSYSWY